MSPADPRPAADPIFAAIAASRRATQAAVAALATLDEDDAAQMCRANAAVDRDADARDVLRAVLPTTAEGLRALAAFHVADATAMEPDGLGLPALCHLSDALAVILAHRTAG